MIKNIVIFPLMIALSFSSLSSATTIAVMRHGEAKQNVAHVLNANVALSENFPLTTAGEKQVHEAAKTLRSKFGFSTGNVRMIFASPLLRTRQTAEILARDLGIDPSRVAIDERLRENGMGRLEGHSEKELDALDNRPGGYLPQADRLFGGETKKELIARLEKFKAELRGARSNNVIVVTHGTPASEFLILLDPRQAQKPELGRGDFRVVEFLQK